MLGFNEKGIKIPDALIAASSVYNNIELFTLNRKDFDFAPHLRLYNPKF